jgi:uncharacterized membrane protein SpoIIM required for sporulation
MRESVFIKNNKKKWLDFENLINSRERKSNPDELADLYIKITDDLAFAQTQYPGSRSHKYLNMLASKIHHKIYRNRREKKSRLITFWQYELPELFYDSRKYFLYSLIFFLVAVAIGMVSTHFDQTYSRLVMSDGYINMTLENIKNGEPMGVYSSGSSSHFFLKITLNNIFVAVKTFALGLAFSIGTVYILLENGIMLGSFQYFFHQQGLFLESFLSIWIHGAIEISSIVLAGGAGLLMGNSFIFPDSYSRLHSLKMGAKKGLKIMISLVPFFIAAGFLESYVTRLFHLHWTIKALIIALSFAVVMFYFVIYPRLIKTRPGNGKN